MATTSEGFFCIREYVSKMRSVDEGRCWPFDDGEISRPSVERVIGGAGVLPPMDHRRFRWWSFEYDRSRLSDTHEEPAVCTASESRETTTADVVAQDGGFGWEDGSCVLPPAASDGQDDDTPADGRRKANGRVPKKRSIVEIFANAPEVIRFQAQRDTSVNIQDDSFTEKKWKKKTLFNRNKRKKNKMVKKTKIVGVRDLGQVVTKKRKVSSDADKESKRTKTEKMMAVEATAEISCDALKPCSIDGKQKLHVVTPSSESNKDALTGRQLGKKTDAPPTDIHKRSSQDARKVPKKCGLKEKRSAKTSTKCEKGIEVLLPVSSILKTRAGNGIKKISTKRLDKDDQKLGMCSNATLQKIRRVRFSDKDDILGQKTRSAPFMDPVESPQEFSELMAATSLHKLSCAASETEGSSEKVNVNTAKEDVCIPREVISSLVDGDGNTIQNENNQVNNSLDGLTVDIDTSSHSRSSAELTKSSALDCVDLNETIDGACMASSQCISQETIQRQRNFDAVMRTNPDVGMQADIGTPWLSNANRRLQTIADRPDVSDPLPCLNHPIYSCRASSSLIMENEPAILKSRPAEPNSESCFFHYTSGFPIPIHGERSPSMLTELVPTRRDRRMSTSCFQPVYNPSVVPTGQKIFNEDFVGLPLNSRGGLTQMQDQIFRRQAVVTGPANAYPHCDVTDTNDLGGCKSSQGTLYGSVGRSTDELNLFSEMHCALNESPVASGSRSSFDLNNLKRVEADSESISLFGIGSRKLNQRVDHKGKDKIGALDFLSGSTQSASLPSVRLMGKTVTVGRSSEMNIGSRDPVRWVDKEIIAEQRPPFPTSDMGNRSMKFRQIIQPVPDPKFSNWAFKHNPQLVCKDRFPVAMERYGTTGHSVAPLAISNYPIQIFGPQVTVNESSNINYPSSVLISGSVDALNHPDHVYKGSSSTFHFSSRNFRNPMQFSWAETDNPGIPPWLLNARIKDTKVLSSQIYYDPTYRQRLFDLPSSSPSPSQAYLGTSFPSAIIDTGTGSSFSAPYHAHLTPLPPSNNHNSSRSFVESSSALNYTGKSAFGQKVSGSKTLAFDSGTGTNGTIRKMAPVHDPFVHGGNMALKKLKRKSTANSTRTVSSFRSLMVETAKAQNGSAKDKQIQEFPVSVGVGGDKPVNSVSRGTVNYSKTGCTRSGPIKLSAGVKHIIMPDQQSNQPGSTMTHSTLPFVGMPSGNNLGLKKKAARIYKL